MQPEDMNCLKVESGKGFNVYAHSWVKRRKGCKGQHGEKSRENRALGDGSAEAVAQSWGQAWGCQRAEPLEVELGGRALWIDPDRPVASYGDLG